MARKEAATIEFSPRSQASILRQEKLERQREEVEVRIAHDKAAIAELEKKREAYARTQLQKGGDGFSGILLERCIAELRMKKDLLEVHEGQLREIEAGIAACLPTAESAPAREENQKALAALAEERLALDADVDAALDTLRSLLEQRGQLSARMAERAQALELALDLDQGRFDALAAALPAKVERQSRAWAEGLFGRENLPVRAVARERLLRKETLAHTGIYQVGEPLELTEEEFAEQHRADRPDPQPHEGWRRKPQSVWTPEEYEAAAAEAKRKGIKVEEVIFWQDMKLWEEGKANFYAYGSGGQRAASTFLR